MPRLWQIYVTPIEAIRKHPLDILWSQVPKIDTNLEAKLGTG